MCGAIFANATGAGGGVVFIPLFHALGFGDGESVATSFGIQCCGMTMGAIAWTQHYRHHMHEPAWPAFIPTIALCAPCSIAGLWAVYSLDLAAPAETVTTFAVFSLVLGGAILLVARDQRPATRHALERADVFALIPVTLIGGVITAWLSVGVGEFVAFYLILRRYDVTQSVAIAVALSAITVWSAVPEHLLADGQAVWPVIAFAGPGAIIGAVIARTLALKLGANRLKRFFGFWLLLIGAAELLPG